MKRKIICCLAVLTALSAIVSCKATTAGNPVADSVISSADTSDSPLPGQSQESLTEEKDPVIRSAEDIPDASEIVTAEVSCHRIYGRSYFDMVFDDPKCIELITEKHRELYQTEVRESDELLFAYRLKDGTTLTAGYARESFDMYEELISNKDILLAVLDYADIENENHTECRVYLWDYNITGNTLLRKYNKRLYEAIKADIQEHYDDDGEYVGVVFLSHWKDDDRSANEFYTGSPRRDETQKTTEIAIKIKDNYTQTLKYLEELKDEFEKYLSNLMNLAVKRYRDGEESFLYVDRNSADREKIMEFLALAEVCPGDTNGYDYYPAENGVFIVQINDVLGEQLYVPEENLEKANKILDELTAE